MIWGTLKAIPAFLKEIPISSVVKFLMMSLENWGNLSLHSYQNIYQQELCVVYANFHTQ